jgi:catechol 2,3-dioxygenase-like lactoylglutathione lyase family enzyme
MAAPFHIVGIDHVVLRAADPAALERFYMDVLGCAFEKRQGTLAQLRAGHALIDIVPADEARPKARRRPAAPISIISACAWNRSMRRPSPGISPHAASAAARRRHGTAPRARARPFTCTIPKATASSSRARSRLERAI